MQRHKVIGSFPLRWPTFFFKSSEGKEFLGKNNYCIKRHQYFACLPLSNSDDTSLGFGEKFILIFLGTSTALWNIRMGLWLFGSLALF